MSQPSTESGSASQTWVIDLSASEPIIQKTISEVAKGLGERFSTSDRSAPASAEMAIPARIKVKEAPRGPASVRRSSTPSSAVPSAVSGSARVKAAASPV